MQTFLDAVPLAKEKQIAWRANAPASSPRSAGAAPGYNRDCQIAS